MIIEILAIIFIFTSVYLFYIRSLEGIEKKKKSNREMK